MLDAATDSTPPPPIERARAAARAQNHALPPLEVYYSMRQVAIALGMRLPDGSPNTVRAKRRLGKKATVRRGGDGKRTGHWYTTKSLLRRHCAPESGEIIAHLERLSG